MIFRDALESDLPAVVALLLDDALGAAREQPGHPAYLKGFRAMQAQGGRIILAIDGAETVACLQLDILHGVSTLGQSRAQVEGVRVAAHRRGQGIGAALMQEAIRNARAAQCGLLQLTTNLTRTDAQRFYKSLGFTHSHAGMKLPL